MRLLEVTIQQQNDEPDETEQPSDFCDFGYDVVSNADPKNGRQGNWNEAVQEAS